jgi:hypothetical protein
MLQSRSATLTWLLVLLAAGCGKKGDPGGPAEAGRHREAAGGFSYVPPPGWTVRSFGGLKYQAVVGPSANGFATNLNFQEEAFAGGLDQYVAHATATARRALPTYRELAREDFKTDSGLAGKKTSFETVQGDRRLRHANYVFDKKGTMLIATFTCLADGAERQGAVFDACAKSIRLE